ncbi:MAG: hypothetical protein ACC656_00045, partial [Candidatus Heimdallarchaeota archaeon]
MYLPNNKEAEELNLKDFELEDDSASWEYSLNDKLLFIVLDEDGLSADFNHCPAGLYCEDKINNFQDLKIALNNIDNWLN